MNRKILPAHLFVLTCFFLPVATLAQPKYDLRGQLRPGDLWQVKAKMEVGGEMKLVHDGKVQDVKMSVVAQFDYQEKLVEGQPHKLADLRSVRFYETAKATIKIGDGQVEPALRDDRRLIVSAVGSKGKATLFSPSGPLTRDELDLVDTPGNSLLIYALLPEQSVAVKDTWKPTAEVLAALLGMDTVSNTEVECVLTQVADGVATIESRGHVDAAVGGVASELNVKTKCLFDLNKKRITHFGIAIGENRSVGHVSPGLDVVAVVRMAFTSRKESDKLGQKQLAGVPLKAHPAVNQLVYEKPTEYRFYHGRNWFVMDETAGTVSLRLVERGELLAQCNVSAEDGKEDKPPTIEEFQAEVRQALGESFGKFEQAVTLDDNDDFTIYRVVATGKASELPITWIYFMVLDEAKHRAVFAFTAETPLADRLKDVDLPMVSSLEFLYRQADPNAKPTPAKAQKPAATSQK